VMKCRKGEPRNGHVFISHIHEEAELAQAVRIYLEATIEPPLDFMMMRKPSMSLYPALQGRILPGEDWLAHVRLALESANRDSAVDETIAHQTVGKF